MTERYLITNYEFSRDDQLFFDTNIWFYLVGSSEKPDKNASIYFAALERIQQSGCQIYIDVIVLSEFINRYAKYLALKQFNIDSAQYDKFRESKNFKNITKMVYDASEKILSLAKRISSNFESIELNAILSLYSDNKVDFNDQILEFICINNQLKLVTHDQDFKRAKCDILTANYNLLS